MVQEAEEACVDYTLMVQDADAALTKGQGGQLRSRRAFDHIRE